MAAMAPTLHVRPAGPDDVIPLLGLIDALADYEKLPRPTDAARQRLVRDAFGDRRRFETFLAELDAAVVGYAIIFETYSTFLALPTLYLEDLFVRPDARGQGVGKALFEHCRAEAHRRGCGRMEWAVLNWNTPAIKFYERYGARHLAEWRTYRLTADQFVQQAESHHGEC
jgi:GNAT superfamily N-acetyltransferase